jgi:large subunit ribosomal protein L9
MKVILNTDLEGKGELGDIVEVKPGFARNYLFPKELALPVNKHNLDMMKARRKKVEKELEIQRLSATEQKVKIEEITLTFERKAGESAVLFGSVTTADIEKKLEEMGFEIERKKLHLDEPIKRVGHYTCKIKLVKGVDADLKIEVVPEGGSLEPEPKETDEVNVEAEEKEVIEEIKPSKPEPDVTGDVDQEEKAEEAGAVSQPEAEVVEEAEPAVASDPPVTEPENETSEPKVETSEKKSATKTDENQEEIPEESDSTVKDKPEDKSDDKPVTERETTEQKEEPDKKKEDSGERDKSTET